MSLFGFALKTCSVFSEYDKSELGEFMHLSAAAHEPALDPSPWASSPLHLTGSVVKLWLDIAENQALLCGF